MNKFSQYKMNKFIHRGTKTQNGQILTRKAIAEYERDAKDEWAPHKKALHYRTFPGRRSASVSRYVRDELYLYQAPVGEQFADADRGPGRVRRRQVFILYRHERADVRALVAVEMGAVEDVEGRELLPPGRSWRPQRPASP